MSKQLTESEVFAYGIAVGISIHQQEVVTAQKRKEPVKIADTLYFLQDGRERLEQMLNDICR